MRIVLPKNKMTIKLDSLDAVIVYRVYWSDSDDK